jgi:hypothetical protein
MTYCSHCGLIIETYDCPVCGFKNYRPEKPGESAGLPKPVTAPSSLNSAKPTNEIPHHENCPKRSAHMLAGGIGACIMAIAAIILGILPMYNAMHGGWMSFESEGIYLMFIFATVLFIVGASILMGGLYGLFKHYGGYQGLVALIFSLVSPVILLIFTILAIGKESYYSSWHYTSQHYSIGPEIWLGHIFVGIMFILIGMSWRSIYFRIGHEQPNLPVGGLFIFAGFLFIVLFGLTGIPWIMISVTSFAACTLFLLGRAGTENIPAGRAKPCWNSPIPDLPRVKY